MSALTGIDSTAWPGPTPSRVMQNPLLVVSCCHIASALRRAISAASRLITIPLSRHHFAADLYRNHRALETGADARLSGAGATPQRPGCVLEWHTLLSIVPPRMSMPSSLAPMQASLQRPVQRCLDRRTARGS